MKTTLIALFTLLLLSACGKDDQKDLIKSADATTTALNKVSDSETALKSAGCVYTKNFDHSEGNTDIYKISLDCKKVGATKEEMQKAVDALSSYESALNDALAQNPTADQRSELEKKLDMAKSLEDVFRRRLKEQAVDPTAEVFRFSY